MNINFYPRKSTSDKVTVYLWVSWNGLQEPFSTKIRVFQKNWDKKKQKVKENITGADDINRQLESQAAKVRDLFKAFSEKTITKEQIKACLSEDTVNSGQINNLLDLYKRFVDDSIKGERRTKKGKILSPGSIKNYKVTLSNLYNYNGDLSLNKINHIWYNKFTNYLWDELGYYDNSVGGQVKNIKAALNYGVEAGILKEKLYDHKWVFWKEDIDILVLYPEELRTLSQIKFETERLDRIRDIFIIGCITCLRVSNVLNLTEDDLVNDSIKVLSVKTSKPVFIKLNPIALNIINKYKGKYRTLLPEISGVKFNAYLKDMAKELKNTLTVEVSGNDWNKPFIRTRYKRGQPIRVKTDITEMISSHTMRRTGITNLLMSGLSEIEVKAISGHSFGSREFGKYVKIAEQFIDKKAASAWEQIFRAG